MHTRQSLMALSVASSMQPKVVCTTDRVITCGLQAVAINLRAVLP